MTGSYNAIINLSIGDLDFTNGTENIMAIDHVRVDDAISQSFVIEVYDDTALVVEAAIINSDNKIEFEYGYANGPMSKRYQATITKYNPDFHGMGNLLTIEGVATGAVDTKEKGLVTREYKGLISDIVSQIAVEEGWRIGNIVKTRPVYSSSNNSGKESEYKVFKREKQEAKEFIEKVLASEAISEQDGKGDYSFRLETTEEGTFCYFEPKGWESNSSLELSYQYTMGVPHEEIIEFSPQYNDVLSAIVGSNVVTAASMDPNNNDIVNVKVEKDEHPDWAFSRVVGGSSYTASELQSLAESVYAKANMLSYPATLVLRGKPNVKPMSLMSIVVLTRDGYPHHSSGVYFIQDVTDTIEDGLFTTTLNLLKNPMNASSSTSTNASTASGQGIQDTILKEKTDKYLGIPYVWGGSDLSGMDCSGFVWYFFKNEFNYDWPRTTAEGQRAYGTKVNSVAEAKPGDIMMRADPAEHVVIYMGNNQVCHAPQTGDVIKYSELWFTPSDIRRLV